jgi:hypothetical protein
MNTIVEAVLKSKADEAAADARPVSMILLFCCIGLLVSLCMVSLGFDITGHFALLPTGPMPAINAP